MIFRLGNFRKDFGGMMTFSLYLFDFIPIIKLFLSIFFLSISLPMKIFVDSRFHVLFLIIEYFFSMLFHHVKDFFGEDTALQPLVYFIKFYFISILLFLSFEPFYQHSSFFLFLLLF